MVQSTLQRLEPEHRETVAQLLRYGIAGGIITVAVAASYWALAEFAHLDPMVSLTVVFLFFSGVSYVTHGAFSFRGHEASDPHHVRATRFLMVNILGFVLNQFFVWLLVKHWNGPTWWPIIPFILVTPWLTFVLHRRWVYA